MNDNARKLVAALQDDARLRKKFKAAGNDDFEKVARAAGYPCTSAEFEAAVNQAASQIDVKSRPSDFAAAGIVSSAVSSVV